jgi:hypothetical protein
MAFTEDNLREIVTLTAKTLSALSSVMEPDDLVEPTGKYFPDEFKLDADHIEKLVHRMRGYTPLSSELPLALGFQEPDKEAKAGGGCGTGACATGGEEDVARGGFVETADGYGLVVDVRDVNEPTLLTTQIARALFGIVLTEAEVDVPREGLAYASEIAASAMGLGLLTALGSSVYKKGCGGMKMHRGTVASIPDTCGALALFCRTRNISPGRVRSHLPVTQKEAFDEALRLVDGNAHLTDALRDHPETLEDGVFKVNGPAGLLGRLFGRKKPENEISAAQPDRTSTKKPRTREEEARLAEARQLVREALDAE